MTALARIEDAALFGAGAEIEAELQLDGRALRVRGRLTGPPSGPAVIAIGGVSGHRHIADGPEGRGWWREQARPGGPLDPARTRCLCFDFLDDSASGFPTTQDQARAALALADAAGLDRFAVIGASYGGMIGLQIAVLAPKRVTRLFCVSAADRASATARGWRSIQREMVELADRLGAGSEGLDLARRLAMTTYRTPEEFEQRFAEPAADSRDAAGVEAYLAARGAAPRRRASGGRGFAAAGAAGGF